MAIKISNMPDATLPLTQAEYIEVVQGGTNKKVSVGNLSRGGPNAGADGLSAYEVAVINGFVGTEAAWLDSLHGAPGEPGAPGQPGTNGTPGQDGANGVVKSSVTVGGSASGTNITLTLDIVDWLVVGQVVAIFSQTGQRAGFFRISSVNYVTKVVGFVRVSGSDSDYTPGSVGVGSTIAPSVPIQSQVPATGNQGNVLAKVGTGPYDHAWVSTSSLDLSSFIATQIQAIAGLDNTKFMTPLRVAEAVPAASTTVIGKSRFSTPAEIESGTLNNIGITPAGLKSYLGAGNNLSRLAKAYGRFYTTGVQRNGRGFLSCTRLATGQYQLVLSNPAPPYTVCVNACNSPLIAYTGDDSTNVINVFFRTPGNSWSDPTEFNIIVF